MLLKRKNHSKSKSYIRRSNHVPTRMDAKRNRQALLQSVDIDDFHDFVENLTTKDVYGEDEHPRVFAKVIGKVNMAGWDNYSDRDFITYPGEHVLAAGGKIETVLGEEILPEDASKFVVITSGLNMFQHMAENAYIARRILPTMHMERIVGFENGCIQTESGGTLTPLTCYELKR